MASSSYSINQDSGFKRFQRVAEPFLYSAPSFIILFAVMLVPLIIGISYAFREIILLDPNTGDFVGLQNFKMLMKDAIFFNALKNTFWWTFYSLFFQFFLGLILALLLNRPFKGRMIVQALIFLPWAVPSFLTGLNWSMLFDPTVGPIPHWMVSLGFWREPTNLLSDPNYALWGPIIANIWWGIPFFAITLLAALQSIPNDLYEAASIDGANPLQKFFSITLPFLAPTISITILLRTVWIANFADLIVIMTRGGPADKTQIVASYIFTKAYSQLDFGYASAIALALLVLLLAYSLTIVILRQAMLKRG